MKPKGMPKGVRRDYKDSDYSITIGSRKPKPKSDLNTMSRLGRVKVVKGRSNV